MNIDIFTLCDSAQEYSGRLIIVGTFNTINVGNLPTVYPEFAIAAKISLDPDYKPNNDEHLVKVYIKKSDSDVYFLPPLEHRIKARVTPDYSDFNLIMRFNGLPINEDGRYVVTMEFDSTKAETNLFVKLNKPVNNTSVLSA
jgi:hypothetical protein